MSSVDHDIAERVRSHLRDLCRRQWHVLAGASPAGAGPTTTAVIDPEALMLLSLLDPEDPELAARLEWWADAGSRSVHAARLRALLRRCPPSLADALSPFAARAVRTGDRRWRPYAGHSHSTFGDTTAAAPPRFDTPSALMLRVRQSLGLGNVADMLALLLGLASGQHDHPAWMTIEGIASALCCSVPAARRAAAQLQAAGQIQASALRPVLFTVAASAALRYATKGQDHPGGREEVLVLPPWRPWVSVLEIVSHGLSRMQAADAAGEGRLLPSLTTLLAANRGLLAQCGLGDAEVGAADSMPQLGQVLVAVAEWAEASA